MVGDGINDSNALALLQMSVLPWEKAVISRWMFPQLLIISSDLRKFTSH